MSVNRQVNPNTESVDNYLKAIFTLGDLDGSPVTSTALARHLGIAPASVTNMLQKLASSPSPLVDYRRSHGVRLSPRGKMRALEVIRHHRLIETFLYQVLDYPIEEVHEEAERLEHFISERLEERIAAKLGYPDFDPHGHIIPALDGRMPKQKSMRLSEAPPDRSFVVTSVSDQDASILGKIKANGIGPGVHLRTRLKTEEGDHLLLIGNSRRARRIPFELAHAINVRLVADS
jgi:DtxR family Mn-dependent transcriptional regulator